MCNPSSSVPPTRTSAPERLGLGPAPSHVGLYTVITLMLAAMVAWAIIDPRSFFENPMDYASMVVPVISAGDGQRDRARRPTVAGGIGRGGAQPVGARLERAPADASGEGDL